MTIQDIVKQHHVMGTRDAARLLGLSHIGVQKACERLSIGHTVAGVRLLSAYELKVIRSRMKSTTETE